MSTTHSADAYTDTTRRLTTETKASTRTSEFLAYIVLTVAIVITSIVVGDGDSTNGDSFTANDAVRYITYLTIGYMVARGLAKAGSRERYDEVRDARSSRRTGDPDPVRGRGLLLSSDEGVRARPLRRASCHDPMPTPLPKGVLMQPTTRLIAAGAVLALVGAAAPPASASSDGDVAALGLGSSRVLAATSTFYAGFVGTGVGDAVTAATFRVPELACGETDEGFVTTVYAISEDGEFLAGPDLFSYCDDGEFVLNGRITTSGGQIPIWQDMQPGDKVRLSIAKRSEGPSTHDVSFSSLTRGWASTLPTNSPIERIEIAHRRMSIDGVRIPPPDYGRVKVKDVIFDDVPLREADATRVQLVDDDGDVLINAARVGLDNFRLVSKID